MKVHNLAQLKSYVDSLVCEFGADAPVIADIYTYDDIKDASEECTGYRPTEEEAESMARRVNDRHSVEDSLRDTIQSTATEMWG
jgi:aldehyde:ferredoxin oxidoreductase